jgi:hypothetical protein
VARVAVESEPVDPFSGGAAAVSPSLRARGTARPADELPPEG